jgi:DNA primase
MMGVERRSQIEIRIMQLPRGTDPDELLLEEGGPQRWEKLRDDALPLVDHVIAVATGKYDLKSARGKSEAVGELALFIRELGDPVQRAHYAQRIAAILRVPEESVLEAISRARRGQGSGARGQGLEIQNPNSKIQNVGLPDPLDPNSAPEEHLLCLVLIYPQVTWMAGAPALEDFTRLENRLIYEATASVASQMSSDGATPEAIRNAVREKLDAALAGYMERLLARSLEPELYRFALPFELESRLKRLRQHNDRMWSQQYQYMLQEAEEMGDAETISKLRLTWSRSLHRHRFYDPKPSTVFRDSRD